MTVDRIAHRSDVCRRRATAATDDLRATVDRRDRVTRHKFWCTRIHDLGALEVRHATVALGHERINAALHFEQRHENVGGADTTIGAHCQRSYRLDREHVGQVARHQAHHRASGRIERAGRDVRQPDCDCCRDCSVHFLWR